MSGSGTITSTPADDARVRQAQRLVRTFMDGHGDGTTGVGVLEPVIDLALQADPDVSAAGTSLLFTGVVERLADTFVPRDRRALEQVLARVVTRVRSLPQGRMLDARLAAWGLVDETDLLTRVDRVAQSNDRQSGPGADVGLVFVLSRVTLGADILLTTSVLQTAARKFPDADIVFVGDPKHAQLLIGDIERARVIDAGYGRRQVVTRRILAWLSLVDAMEEAVTARPRGTRYLVIDLDSRLLQSGVLPAMPPADEPTDYHFWRGTVSPETRRPAASQGEDVVRWLATRFGEDANEAVVSPRICLSGADDDFAETCRRQWKLEQGSTVVSVNLGVGGNEAKRVSDGSFGASLFEQEVVRHLLLDGASVIVDSGAGRTELRRAAEIANVARAEGFCVLGATERWMPANADSRRAVGRLLLFEGSVARFAALVRLSDLYIGYDSLGQHIAGALGKNIITVFAGYASPLFVSRWKPMSAGVVRTLEVGTGPFSAGRQQQIVADVLSAYRSLTGGP